MGHQVFARGEQQVVPGNGKGHHLSRLFCFAGKECSASSRAGLEFVARLPQRGAQKIGGGQMRDVEELNLSDVVEGKHAFLSGSIDDKACVRRATGSRTEK